MMMMTMNRDDEEERAASKQASKLNDKWEGLVIQFFVSLPRTASRKARENKKSPEKRVCVQTFEGHLLAASCLNRDLTAAIAFIFL